MIGDDRLVFRSVVDVEVVDAGIQPQLSVRCASRGGDCCAGVSNLVGGADTHQPRAMQQAGVPSRIERTSQEPRMSRNGTWLITAATSRSRLAAASALPPPIEDPNVTTRFGSTPGHRRAKAIASPQSWSCRAGSNRSRVPPLSPNPRWSNTSAKHPCCAKRSANAPRRSRRVPDSPCAITTTGTPSDSLSSGSYIHVAHWSPATSNCRSILFTRSRRREMVTCEIAARRRTTGPGPMSATDPRPAPPRASAPRGRGPT